MNSIFGITVGLVGCVGIFATMAVLPTIYREANCFMRLLVIGIAIGLLWKVGIAFSHPRWIDLGDGLVIAGITAVYLRRLWTDHTGTMFDFWRG